MSFRDFDAEAEERTEGEPIEFQLGGHKFTITPPVPLGGMVLIARAMSEDNMKMLAAADRMMRSWLPKDRWSDWDDTLANLTDVTKLEKVIEHVLEKASGRPT